jgi:carbon-monoxide dehydrogenase small subunit
MQVSFVLNEKDCCLEVAPDDMLANALRNIGVLSIRMGCDTSCCGLCTVWVDKKPILSCTMPAFRVAGKSVTTIDGIQHEAEQFARILSSEGAEQCGFCSPGFIMTVIAMKNELINPSEEDIIHYLTGNLCRCTGYMGQMRAIRAFLAEVEK